MIAPRTFALTITVVLLLGAAAIYGLHRTAGLSRHRG